MEKARHASKFTVGNPVRDNAARHKEKKKEVPDREFSVFEEIAHSVTHGGGALLGIVGLVLLIIRASQSGAAATVAASIFGASLIILYSASCAYHSSCAIYGSVKPSRVRDICMKCDHSLIYLLILGTYAPACISAMGGFVGYTVFGVVLACCLVGIVLNVIDVERFKNISLALYVIAGWTIAVAIKPFYNAIGTQGTVLLVLGGISYTIGILFYKAKNTKYMHIIWHFFVLLGSIFHYLMVYFYCF